MTPRERKNEMGYKICILEVSGKACVPATTTRVKDFQGVVVDNNRDGEVVFVSKLCPSEKDTRRACRDYIDRKG